MGPSLMKQGLTREAEEIKSQDPLRAIPETVVRPYRVKILSLWTREKLKVRLP
jgi:hypothetical protein